MELVLVIVFFIGFLLFFGWTMVPSKNRTGRSQLPLIGFGVFLVLSLGALFSYNQTLKQAETSIKEKAVAQPKMEQKSLEEKPKTEEKQTTEEQPKSEEPPKVMDNRVEIVHGPGSKVRGPADPKYVMDVTYDSNQHIITGTMSVEFKNNLDVDLNDVYFNVWANAFNFYPNGETEPNVKISQLKLNGQPTKFTLERTVLHIPEVPIKKGNSAKVEMEFSVKIPETLDRFGWNKTATSLGN